MRQNIELKIDDYNLFDNIIIQDENLNIENPKENKKNFIRIENLRYSLDWLNEVENSYRYKLKEYSLNLTKENNSKR